MTLEIRRVETSDIEDIRELNEASWREAYGDIIPGEKLEGNTGNYPEKRLKEKMRDDKLLFLVAEIDGKVVGTINFCWGMDNTHDFVDVDDDEAQLRAVYLHPDYWGQGIGTQLFEKGLEKIPENIEVLKVESLKENRVGQGVYRKLGFKNVKESEATIFGDRYESVIWSKEID